MLNSRIFWKIYSYFLLFIAIAAVIVGAIVTYKIREGELETARTDLTKFAIYSTKQHETAAPESITEHFKEVHELADVRLTLLNADGTVTADTDIEPATMDNHLDRPEIREARENGIGSAIRNSPTLGTDTIYVALPIVRDGKLVGYSRASISLADVNKKISTLRSYAFASIAFAVVLAMIFGAFLTRQIVSPLRRMTTVANAIADGDLAQRVPIITNDEFSDLARSLNSMADRLARDIAKLKNAEAALLCSTEDLEIRVVERTAELTKANELLSEQILEREITESVLQMSEERYRELVENANDIIYTTDLRGRLTSLNKAGEALTGYRVGRDSEISILTVIAPEFHQLVQHMNEQMFLIGSLRTNYEIEIFAADGRRLTLEVSSRILMRDNKPIGIHSIARDITQRKETEQQLMRDAFYDGLTELANRALFMDHLRLTIERSKGRAKSPYAVLFLDIDRFKVINDSLGHLEGDELLKQVAARLNSAVRHGDLVARLGGDEFVILAGELPNEAHAVLVAERVQAAMREPFYLKDGEVFVTVSVGIDVAEDGEKSAEDMIRDADTAMYRAKSKGRAQYQIFNKSMREQASKQLQIDTEMRHALERNEFEMYYQPIVEIATEKFIGFEALVRWCHPTLGVISPFEFINAAEENGLILPLGSWILEESCRQLRVWQTKYEHAANITVAVNLSPKQFSQANFPEIVSDILVKTGLNPKCLKLEITESQIMENDMEAIRMMHKLRDLKIELSLDDFGTGYSSLSYLHRLPVNYLKIDRSFVSRMSKSAKNADIVMTIIRLAQNLKKKVIAEGVETAEQLEQLRNLKCEFAQGYFFSKPMSAPIAGDYVENAGDHYILNNGQSVIDLQMQM